MSIRLSEAQIEQLRARQNIIAWRPQWCRIVHLRDVNNQPYWGMWTLCNETKPELSTLNQFDWGDKFCAKCVKAALK